MNTPCYGFGVMEDRYQPIRVLRWVYRQQTYQILRRAEAQPIPYVLVDERGQVLSGITERDLRWYRQRIKEPQP